MDLIGKIKSKKANIGIIGLGYVGLPLVIRFGEEDFNVIGCDIDQNKVEKLNRGESYIRHIPTEKIRTLINKNKFQATSDYSRLKEVDCIIICVPTPLSNRREPDLSYIENTSDEIAKYLKDGQLISLESTTYPGTTREILLSRFENNGLKVGEDFFLVFSPERENPGDTKYNTKNIPKVVGGITSSCTKVGKTLYEQIVDQVVVVSSTEVAEFTKLLENIFRAVNIALVNELKMLADRMGIDIWEVIETASTKPFGFMPFYPGPGLGGHCIPIDPFYLTWKAREYDFHTRFIELAGEINTQIPYYIVEKVNYTLNKSGKSFKGSKVLVLGIAYKKDVDDQRESPSLKIIQLLREHGAEVIYNDPHVPECKGHRHYPDINMKSIELTDEILSDADITLLLTDHTAYDYVFIEKHARCIVDTRNVFGKNGIKSWKIYKT